MGDAWLLRTDSGLPLHCFVQDLDGDARADHFDNCPLDANPDQADGDADGFGDACDLCPATFDLARADSDRDGVGDRCDLCPFFGNTDQLDTDGDGSGNLCDPDPSSAALGVPSDAIQLSLSHDPETDETTVNWNAEARSTSYEVYRGSREEIEARFYGACQNSRDAVLTDTSFVEDETPNSGELFHILVVGVAANGSRGLAGPGFEDLQRDLRAKDCL